VDGGVDLERKKKQDHGCGLAAGREGKVERRIEEGEGVI
jgi:hypothetical protein